MKVTQRRKVVTRAVSGVDVRSDVVAEADVVVVGGGFVGLATAIALGKSGRKVVVLESRIGADRRFRGELVHPGGARVLEELGILPAVGVGLVRGCRGFAVTSAADDDPMLLDYPVTGAGTPGAFTMHHEDLRGLLLEAIEKQSEITLISGTPAVGVIYDRGAVAGVTTRQNSVVRAGLTVLCDGRFSSLRRDLGFTPAVDLVSYTLVLTPSGIPLPHPGYGHVFLGGPGPVLAYEVAGGAVRVCVDIPLHLAKAYRRREDQIVRSGYVDHLPEAIRGPFVDALRTPGSEMSANVKVMGAPCWAPGLVLMGDSAVCSHPLTAMGMTAGLRDAIALRNELDRGPDQASALYRFERYRQRDVWLRQTFTDSLYQIFSGPDEVNGALRTGLFRHWRGSDRARANTIALLAGDDRRLPTFISEYTKVVFHAMAMPGPGGFRHAVSNRIDLADSVLHVIRGSLAQRRHGWAALLRARVARPGRTRRRRREFGAATAASWSPAHEPR
jgi:2-polyprenyl-6-methoxyphenol hydroxylase-like FAD-dependent oxidoreductase